MPRSGTASVPRERIVRRASLGLLTHAQRRKRARLDHRWVTRLVLLVFAAAVVIAGVIWTA
jgi:hypothetical protein